MLLESGIQIVVRISCFSIFAASSSMPKPGFSGSVHQAVGGERRILHEVQLLGHVVDEVLAERAHRRRLAGDDVQRRVDVVAVRQ